MIRIEESAAAAHVNAVEGGVDRRAVLAALIGVAAGATVWTEAGAAQALKTAGASAPVLSALPASLRSVLAAAADVIVPRTSSPGAVQAGVPAFIESLYRHWMTENERMVLNSGLQALETTARSTHRRGFAALSPAQRGDVLQSLREGQPYPGHAVALADRITDPKAPFYIRLRDLVVFGYFTSEVGCTKALRYFPVPGSFEGDVPMKDWPYQMVI